MHKHLPDSLLSQRILLVGGGKMGSAMLHGWRDAGFAADRFRVQEPNPSDDLAAQIDSLNPSLENLQQTPPDIIVLAIKPQMAAQLLPELASVLQKSTLVISLMAGLSLNYLSELLGGHGAIIRTMPNTPAAIGKGMTALTAATFTTGEQKQDALHLMQAVGEAIWLDSEKQMDAVTAVSGSGPAYLFYFTETMISAGTSLGLSQELASQLAKQTIIGAVAMLEEDASPASLRRNVTSPQGTTEAALDVLMAETGGLGKLMRQTLQAAAQRSRELAEASEKS
jgi:pyrroline-5-carboxylate reductase